ncbi:MAG: hypothetical protein GXY48_05790 [Methanomicrobiales archaeon]|nr:hypothetical protein [Methanomicrobiales archaeon]
MNNRFVLSLIIFTLLLLFCIPVDAYYLTIDAPSQVKVGEPILVSGSTNTPPPDKIDVVFSQSVNIPVEIDRQSIEITEKGDVSFNVTFQTTGLEKGNYKIEGLSQSKRDFSGGSRSLRVIKLVDRSDLITLLSPTWQEFEKELNIEAKIAGYTENAIQMEIKKGNETLFGPESVPVSHSVVKYQHRIVEPGLYEISFSDYNGFIGTYEIVTEEKDLYSLTGGKSVIIPTVTSDLAIKPALVGDEKPSVTMKPEVSDDTKDIEEQPRGITGVSSGAEVSRDSPAYFMITTNETPILIQTSKNSDFVMEYKTSPDAAIIKVNDEIGNAPETVKISESVSEIYLKVYPYSYKSTDMVTVTADTAESISLSDTAAKAFGVPPRYGNDKKSGNETPLPSWIILVALSASMMVIAVKRR